MTIAQETITSTTAGIHEGMYPKQHRGSKSTSWWKRLRRNKKRCTLPSIVDQYEESSSVDDISDLASIASTDIDFSNFQKPASREDSRAASPTSLASTIILTDLDEEEEYGDEEFNKDVRHIEFEMQKCLDELHLDVNDRYLAQISERSKSKIRDLTEVNEEQDEEPEPIVKLTTSSGVMMFNGMDDKKIFNDDDSVNDIILAEDRDNDNKTHGLNFIKAPKEYDPVKEGFLQKSKWQDDDGNCNNMLKSMFACNSFDSDDDDE